MFSILLKLRSFTVLILISLIFVSTPFSKSFGANPEFEQIDGYIDEDCPTWTIDRFKQVEKWVTFGVDDAVSYGYTYQFPISRRGVDAIWCAIVPDRGSENEICTGDIVDLSDLGHPFATYRGMPAYHNTFNLQFSDLEDQYMHYFNYVKMALLKEKDLYPNVGKVLEILSRYYMQVLTDQFPSEVYTIGSGVEYRYDNNESTIGELDIIVYDRKSCEVKLIGEAKASSPGNQYRSLNKATEQLKRFKDFIRPYVAKSKKKF